MQYMLLIYLDEQGLTEARAGDSVMGSPPSLRTN